MTCSRSQGLVDFFRPKIVSLLSLKTMCEIPLLFGDGSNKKKHICIKYTLQIYKVIPVIYLIVFH